MKAIQIAKDVIEKERCVVIGIGQQRAAIVLAGQHGVVPVGGAEALYLIARLLEGVQQGAGWCLKATMFRYGRYLCNQTKTKNA